MLGRRVDGLYMRPDAMRAVLLAAAFPLCLQVAPGIATSAGASEAKAEPAKRGAATKDGRAYPSKPVRFIIPFPPGGGTDIVGRALGQKLAERLGEPFIVDNRPGAAGTVGSNIAAKAAADGHTLLLATASFAISAGYYRNLPYDSVKDFDAVGLIASQPLALVVHPSMSANSVKDVIALAKAAPDKLNYASSGTGGITHLATEMFRSMTGTRIVHVPYKGSNPAITAVLAGEVPIMIAPVGPALPHIRAGKLRALAVSSEKRTPLLAGLPTIAESGVPGYEAGTWYGMLAPRGTPPNITNVLNKQILAALESADVVERLASQAFDPVPSTPKQFADYLTSEIRKWAQAMKDAGVKGE